MSRQGRSARDYERMERRRRQQEMNSRQNILDWLGTVAKWVLIVLLIMFFVSLSKKAYSIGYNMFSEKAMAEKGEGETIAIEITSDMSLDTIGQLLQDNGLLEDGSVFRFQERFSNYHGEIKPGTYDLSTEMTPQEMIAIMAGHSDDLSAVSTTEEIDTSDYKDASELEKSGTGNETTGAFEETEGVSDAEDASETN